MRSVPVPIAVVLAMAAGLAGCEEEATDPCIDHKHAIGRCGLEYVNDVCASESGRCAAACYDRATCEELAQADEGETPGWLSICLYPCRDTFACGDGSIIFDAWVCDGENDCIDGSDERACSYLECGNGELVDVRGECDEWPDCSDWSDEDGCEHVVCGDYSIVKRSGRCDGSQDCVDGRDEEDCP